MSPTSVFARGNTALITGAASGIGLAVAKLCRSKNMNLALVDNSSENLALAKESLASSEQITETYTVDVSKTEQWHDLRDKVKKTFGDVDFLMLNAAVGGTGGWENVEYFRKIMDTNLFGVINGISTFLPVIQSQQKAKPSAIVITGSKQGITNVCIASTVIYPRPVASQGLTNHDAAPWKHGLQRLQIRRPRPRRTSLLRPARLANVSAPPRAWVDVHRPVGQQPVGVQEEGEAGGCVDGRAGRRAPLPAYGRVEVLGLVPGQRRQRGYGQEADDVDGDGSRFWTDAIEPVA